MRSAAIEHAERQEDRSIAGFLQIHHELLMLFTGYLWIC